MADEFYYVPQEALHGTEAMEQLTKHYGAELREGYVVIVGAGATVSGIASHLPGFGAESFQCRLAYVQPGGIPYGSEYGQRHRILRLGDDLPMGLKSGFRQPIEIRTEDVVASIRSEFARLKAEDQAKEGAERQDSETDANARLEEIRRLLWESRQLGKQIREGIDSLKDRAPVVK
jgi:hypothetical protein